MYIDVFLLWPSGLGFSIAIGTYWHTCFELERAVMTLRLTENRKHKTENKTQTTAMVQTHVAGTLLIPGHTRCLLDLGDRRRV